jgi:hypothetical protein
VVSGDWYENVAVKMRGSEFQRNFRLHYVTYTRLLSLLALTWPAKGRRNRPLSYTMEKAVLAALWYLGVGGNYRAVTALFGFKRATGWRAIQLAIKQILCLRQRTIRFPQTQEERRSTEQAFFELGSGGDDSGLRHVLGALDGTHIPFIARGDQQKQDATNRKGFTSLILHAIVNAHM